jgi:methionyl-tRNA formyltransferase
MTKRVAIQPRDNAGTLGARLAEIGADLLPHTLEGYLSGEIAPRPQDHASATYAPRIAPEETRIAWTEPAPRLANLIRGLAPQPGAWTTFRSNRLKVLEAVAVSADSTPGVLTGSDGPSVGAGCGALVLERVQPAGKRPMSGADWVRGVRPEPGERFE